MISLAAQPRGRELAVGLLTLAVPIIATNISRTIMSFVDFVMVAQLGKTAIAAIMPARLTVFCLISFGLGLVSVVNTFVSQSLGRGRLRDCSIYAWQGLYLAGAAGVLILPAWWLVEPFYRWTAHGPAIVSLEVAYTRIGVLSVAPTIGAAALANFFTGLHRPVICFVSVVVSNVFNFVANYALIFGHFGFAPMGIAGAAWATLAASILQLLILFLWMFLPTYGRTYGARQTWRLSPYHLWQVVRIGLPSAFQLGIDILTWSVFIWFLVGGFGEIQLAANNICFVFLEISFMPAVGLGMALMTLVGRSIGEGRRDLALRYVRWGLLFNCGYMLLCGSFMAVFRHSLPALITDSAPVVAAVAPLMLLCAVFQLFDGMTITFNSALRGAGDTLWPAILLVTSSLLILVAGGWLLARLVPAWGSMGPWLAATTHIIVAGSAVALRYRFGSWERIELIREGK